MGLENIPADVSSGGAIVPQITPGQMDQINKLMNSAPVGPPGGAGGQAPPQPIFNPPPPPPVGGPVGGSAPPQP